MKLKYALIFTVVLFTYLIADSVVGIAMSMNVTNETPIAEVFCESYEMQATAYCLSGKTASGEQTRSGIVASKPEWIGKRVAIYHKDGDFIGYFDVKDTGGDLIQTGKVIDIWLPTYDECMSFGRQDVVVYLLDEEFGR